MKCRRCGQQATVKLSHHRTAFCTRCFNVYFEKQVERAIKHYKMFGHSEKILLAASGGKDSMVLWDVLLKLGYHVTAFHIDLGIGEYSENSRQVVEDFGRQTNTSVIIHDLWEEEGVTLPDIKKISRKPACAVCGTVKRYIINRITMEQGFPVVVTGHNLSDESTFLFMNTIQWNVPYLEKQVPYLPGNPPYFVRRGKPLYRLLDEEVALYAALNGIPFVGDECPLASGATQLTYKKLLMEWDERMPGIRHQFYFNFLRAREELFEDRKAHSTVEDSPTSPKYEIGTLRRCDNCGGPTSLDNTCSFCMLVDRARKFREREKNLIQLT